MTTQSTGGATAANAEAIEAWNTVLFEKWVRFRHLMMSGLRGLGDVALDRLAPPPGSRVLDVGCGFGDTTLDIARRVGPSGLAVGVDAAARFLDVARSEATAAGLPNARFEVRDVQMDDLGGPYDGAFSRFGTMFFASPVAALRNIRRALVPGARLSIIVWRRREDNPFLYIAEEVVRPMVPLPEETDEPTCGPGPFSMAGADLVSDLLLKAGFVDVGFRRVDREICIGRDVDEAVEFSMALGPAGEILRLAGAEGERLRPQVIAALRDAFTPFARPDGVVAPASCWSVTARAP